MCQVYVAPRGAGWDLGAGKLNGDVTAMEGSRVLTVLEALPTDFTVDLPHSFHGRWRREVTAQWDHHRN